MLNFLKGKFAEAFPGLGESLEKHNTKETAHGIVAIMTGTAFADGDFEADERKKMVQVFNKHQILSKFDFSTLKHKLDELTDVFDMDIEEGLVACLAVLKMVVDKKAPLEQRQSIMRAGVMLAKADGEFEDAEKAFLTRCAKVLGLDPAEYGL